MYDKLIENVVRQKAVKGIYFINPKEIVRVARTHYRQFGFNRGNLELTITRGKPNYAERELAKKMGQEIKGMTFYKYPPQKKKNPSRPQINKK